MSETQNKLVVVGSVAVDHVITPKAEREHSVGGSATFAAMAAAFHAPVKLVGVVGKDFPDQTIKDFESSKIDLEGLEVVPDGLTFRWKGKYHENMNDRDTLETHLNCFEHFDPKLPASYRDASHLFLGNIQPTLQAAVLDQMNTRPKVVGLDTMNLWIDVASDELRSVLGRVDILMINEEEARQLSGKDNLVKAARDVLALGPRHLVIKRGEYGALLFGPDGDLFSAPGLPLDEVADPTGAGDCFAGGFMGYLAGTEQADGKSLRAAMIWGSVMASFCVQNFSYDAIKALDEATIAARYETFVGLADFPRGR